MARKINGFKSEHHKGNFQGEIHAASLAQAPRQPHHANVSAEAITFPPIGELENPCLKPAPLAITSSSAQPQNILFAVHVPPDEQTAVYRNTCDRAAYLESMGHHCTLVTPETFPWLRHTSSRLQPIFFSLAVSKFLAGSSSKFDTAIFHSHAAWAPSLLRKLLKRHRDLKIAIAFHGLEPLYYSRLRRHHPPSLRYRFLHGAVMHRLLRSACRNADRVLCLNSEEEQYLVLNEWAPRARIATLPHPAPEEFFIRRAYSARALNLLFVGQWLPMKGIQYLVEAFTRLSRSHRELRLGCIGTLTPAAAVLDAFPADVRPHVTVRERVTRREVVQFHRHADLFVFPTLSEGFSLALAEAMASGLPIVTTPVGAAPDYLRHQVSTLFVPTAEAGPIVSAVSRLIDDEEIRARLGQAARQSAERLRPERAWLAYGRHFDRLTKSQGEELSA